MSDFIDISDLKHGPALLEFFEVMCSDWMNPAEKIEFINKILELSGMTIKDLDDSMENGVQNGHPVEEQLAALRQVIAMLDDKLGPRF